MKNLTYLVAIALLVVVFLLGRGCKPETVYVVPKTNFAKLARKVQDSIKDQLTEIATLKKLEPGKDSVRVKRVTIWREKTVYVTPECAEVVQAGNEMQSADSSYIYYQRGIIAKQDTVIGQYGRLVALKDSSIGQRSGIVLKWLKPTLKNRGGRP